MSEPADRPGAIPAIMLAQLLDEQRRRWRAGERVNVETFLARLPTLRSDHAVVLDLIYNEIILREQLGDKPRPEEYARRFPHLSDELALQFEVDRFLDAPSADAPAEVPPPIAGQSFPALAGYQIHGVLGRGGMGVVYHAQQLATGRMLAVKLILANVRAGSAEVERFRTELETVALLNHRHFAPIVEIGARASRLYIAGELHDANLAGHVRGSVQSPEQAARWLEMLARAVHAAHQRGVVHGALKPTNVLVRAGGVLKISDFGMATLAGTSRPPNMTRLMLGTSNYLAPEQASATPQCNPLTDVHGLGAILYELLTGQPPFRGVTAADTLEQIRHAEPTPPTAVRPTVPADLEAICLQCLRKEPKERYASAEALAQDLVLFLRAIPVAARHVGVARRVVRWTGGWLNPKTRPAPSAADLARTVLERRLERLTLQLEIARRLIRLASIDGLLPRLAELIAWLIGAESATVFLLDRQRRELFSKVTLRRAGRDVVAEIRQGLGLGIAGAVASTGQPIRIDDPPRDPRFKPAVERHIGPTPRNALVLPMLSPSRLTPFPEGEGKGMRAELLGVMQVVNKLSGRFDDDDVELLTTFAASAAVAIEQAMGK